MKGLLLIVVAALVAVDPAYHRTGVGTKMMIGLLDAAIERGAKTLSLEVYATGVPILRLEAISGERGRDMSMQYPQMTFKVRPGMHTYKVPMTAVTQPAQTRWWRRCGLVPVLARENPDGWCGWYGSCVLVRSPCLEGHGSPQV